jgi:prophage antirepressor-like protein
MDEKKFVDEALKGAIPAVVESLKNELKRSIDYDVKQKAQELISGYVTDWMTEHVLPEIGETLVAMHEPLLESSRNLAQGIADVLTESLIEQVKKALSDSWSRRQVFEALLKS